MTENKQDLNTKFGIKDRILILFSGKSPKKSKQQIASEESASVRGLKKNVKILEAIIDGLEVRVKHLQSEVDQGRQGSMEEKVVDAVIGIFSPSSHKQTHLPPSKMSGFEERQTNLETGDKLSDDDIKGRLQLIPQNYLSMMNKFPDKAREVIKAQMPNISEESITRTLQIAKGMI